jgi:hypothetical protein
MNAREESSSSAKATSVCSLERKENGSLFEELHKQLCGHNGKTNVRRDGGRWGLDCTHRRIVRAAMTVSHF